MKRPVSSFRLAGFSPPVRRVLALDAGTRRVKLLLAESDFGRLRILKEELLDLKAEGLVSAEEVRTHLRTVLDNWGNPAVTLVLPEHVSISQVVDLPRAPESEVDRLIADETIKLSGVTENRVVYDFFPTRRALQSKQEFWVTLCQEADIRERIVRLGLEREDLCDVTSTANCLVAAYRSAAPVSSRAILVHLGAQSTAVVILVAGQPALASSFQMGGDFFTRALARQHSLSEEQAENLKRERNLFSGPDRSEAFVETVNGWVAELKRQLNEWFDANAGLAAEARTFELVAGGGGFDQPGLREFLKSEAALDFAEWPRVAERGTSTPGKGFVIAFGAALQALGHSEQTVSLLPDDYRSAWQKRLSRQRIEVFSFLLLGLCVLLLALGTWRKTSIYSAKKALWDKVQAAQTAVDANDALTSDLVTEYNNLRPIIARQQNTMDVLKSLALIQKSSSKSNLWYVLLADQDSYFSHPPAVLSTNRPAKTNLLGPSLEALRAVPLMPSPVYPAVTNFAPVKPGLIAELCIPGNAEPSRQALSELVNGWQQQPMFSKVDLLSEDLRRTLADPKVIVPDRDYVLSLDFAETDFQQPVRLKKPAVTTRSARRSNRPGYASPYEAGTTPGEVPPS